MADPASITTACPYRSPAEAIDMSTIRFHQATADQAAVAPLRTLPKVSTTASKPAPIRPQRKWGKWILAAAAIAGVVVLVGLWRARLDRSSTDAGLIYHVVKRDELSITVSERGNLESQVNLQVMCEVDDVAGDNINGTPILWIVDNGASVKEGDLIVELDGATLQERLDSQIIQVEEERAEFKQAEVQYTNQKTQNITNLAEAKLAVALSELALLQFGDDEAGTFQIELQDLGLLVQEAEAGRLIEQTNLHGIETLYKLGYRSSGELAEARLNSLRSERQLATAISKRRELVEYKFKKEKMALAGAMASSKRAHEQVSLDNEAQLAQSKARLSSSRAQLAKEEELLERYQTQVANCKIYAPQDGMVAYYTGGSRWRREEIRAGVPVRPRQVILTLPSLQAMQVKTAVHESVLDLTKPGLSATVGVDAFPDAHYNGTVATVAVLPDQGGWLSSDTKVYETVVTIDEEVRQLKPGMTAVVEIHVAHLSDVVTIPVQAVVQIEDQIWCYVEENGAPVRRGITLGMTNSKFVEIRDGIETGERVVLNPSAIPDSSQKSAPSGSDTERATEGASSGRELS